MAKITRKTQKQFGGSLGATGNIRNFGGLAASSLIYSLDPAVIQSSAFLSGWAAAVVGNHSPPLQDMNSLAYLWSYQLGYLLQQGVAEWDSGTTYFHYGLALDPAGTGLYESQQDNNLNRGLLNTSYWLPYSRQHRSPGAACAFTTFAGIDGLVFEAFNCTVVRNSTGDYTVTCAAGWSPDYNSDTITPVVTGSVGHGAPGVISVFHTDNTTARFRTYNLSGVLTDFDTLFMAFFA